MKTKLNKKMIVEILFVAIISLFYPRLGIAEIRTYSNVNTVLTTTVKPADYLSIIRGDNYGVIKINSANLMSFNNKQCICETLELDLSNLNESLCITGRNLVSQNRTIGIELDITTVTKRVHIHILTHLTGLVITTTNLSDRISIMSDQRSISRVNADLKSGNDYIESNSELWCSGRDGNDTIYGSAYNDVISGGNGNDIIHGGWGNDHLYGDQGRDAVYGEEGNDVIDGGAGDDGNEGDFENWDASYRRYGLYGGQGNDLIIDSWGNDYMLGEDGDDCIQGGPGNDMIIGGPGNDRLYGYEACPGQDMYEQIFNDDDYIFGSAGNNIIYGGPGNDHLYGADDDDEIYGEEGDDYIDGRAGNNYLDGGSGDNEIYEGGGLAIDDRPIWECPPLEPA